MATQVALTAVSACLSGLALLASVLFAERVSLFQSGILVCLHILTGMMTMAMIYTSRNPGNARDIVRVSSVVVALVCVFSIVFAFYYFMNIALVFTKVCGFSVFQLSGTDSIVTPGGGLEPNAEQVGQTSESGPANEYGAKILRPIPIPHQIAHEMCRNESEFSLLVVGFLFVVIVANVVTLAFYCYVAMRPRKQSQP